MKSSNTIQIQSTNDSSIVSKLSAVRKGYYKDDFLQYFVDKPQIRSPLTNRGYYIRHKAIQLMLDLWLDNIKTTKECQIISLGAGFDTTYFRLKSENKLSKFWRYIEIDFYKVLQKKWDFICSHSTLKDLIENIPFDISYDPRVILNSTNYALLGVDMSDIQSLNSLCKIVGINFNVPTLVLSECSILYMPADKSLDLIRWVKESFLNSLFVTYEQILPNDGFGLIMKKHFNSLGSPLKSVDVYPDIKSQMNRFLDIGWACCNVTDMNEFFSSLPRDEKLKIQNLELFDEYETWNLKCSHYILLWAFQGLSIIYPYNTKLESDFQTELFHLPHTKPNDICSCLHRFGHRLVYLGKDDIFTIGGFGKLNGKHQRIKGIMQHNLETMEVHNVSIDDTENKLGQRIFHTLVCLENSILVIGGRSAPSKPYKDIVLLTPYNSILSNEKQSRENYFCNANKIAKVKFTCSVINDAGCVPLPRWRHTTSVCKVNEKNYVFLFGGCTAKQNATNDSYLMDTENWYWSQLNPEGEIPCVRHSHSSVTFKNKIFISCGLSEDDHPLNSIYHFDTSTLLWTKLNVNNLLPRYSHTSHVWRNCLFLVGGINVSSISPFLAIINLATLNVTEFSSPVQNPEYPLILCCHDSIIYKGRIHILGGGGNCFTFGTHFNSKILEINLELIEIK